MGLGFAAVLLAGSIQLSWADETCGEQGITCGSEQHCCTHVMAIFSDNGASSPPYVEGRCIPKEEHCGEYWCGNRQCKAGFFGMPSVCCVKDRPGLSTEYKCAYSELNCPGNTQQLTIRPRSSDKEQTLASTILPAD